MQKLIALFLIASISHSAVAAIPVIDPAAITQAINQVNNQVKQIEAMRAQIKAATDNGNYASLLNDPKMRAALERHIPKGYEDLLANPNGKNLNKIHRVLEREKLRSDSMTGVQRARLVGAQTEVQLMGMMETLNIRSQSIERLQKQINTTENIAQKQDLLNTLNAQAATINVDLARMQVMMEVAKREEEKAQRQAYQEWRKAMDKRTRG